VGQHSNWQRHLDEVFVKTNSERFYLCRAVDHEGEVLECFVTKRRNKVAAKKLLIKAIRKYGSPKIITTDKLPSYSAAFHEIGIAKKQLCGGWSNNRCENSHLPFGRRERGMQLSQSNIQPLSSRKISSKQRDSQTKRSAALLEWFQICAS
jgi:putative transposase